MKKLSFLILFNLINASLAMSALNDSDVTKVKIVQQKLGESHKDFKNRVGDEIEKLKNEKMFITAEVNENDLSKCGNHDSAHSVHLCTYKLHYK